MRSSVGGWLRNSLLAARPPNGAEMYMCCMAPLVSARVPPMRILRGSELPFSSLASALARANGLPVSSAPVWSAIDSRERVTASWMMVAAIGATIAMASSAKGCPLLSRRHRRRSPRSAP